MSDGKWDNEPTSDPEDSDSPSSEDSEASSSSSQAIRQSVQDHRFVWLASARHLAAGVLVICATVLVIAAVHPLPRGRRAALAHERFAMQPSQGNCARIGCHGGYDMSLPCQCTSRCGEFGNCCIDYYEVCAKPPATSQGGYHPEKEARLDHFAPSTRGDENDYFEDLAPSHRDDGHSLENSAASNRGEHHDSRFTSLDPFAHSDFDKGKGAYMVQQRDDDEDDQYFAPYGAPLDGGDGDRFQAQPAVPSVLSPEVEQERPPERSSDILAGQENHYDHSLEVSNSPRPEQDEGGDQRGARSPFLSVPFDVSRATADPPPVALCAVFRCAAKEYVHGASCQCTEDCSEHRNCCDDYNKTCGFARPGCHTSIPGEACYDAVVDAMSGGVFEHPEDYPGLTPQSSFAEFQVLLHNKADQGVDCPLPCKAVGPPEPKCLCLFDVDRTLTARQDAHCREEGTYVVPGVFDGAPPGGNMVLSELAQNIQQSFCVQCLRGVVSNSDLGGPGSAERRVVHAAVGGAQWTLTDEWRNRLDGRPSSLMVGVQHAEKHLAAFDILDWLRNERGIEIDRAATYYFDDGLENIRQFVGTGLNAQQISCTRRDPDADLGLCGGRAEELSKDTGVLTCEDKGVVDESLLGEETVDLLYS